MEFEWDPEKARANLAKHGVAFEAALQVFHDLFALEWLDLDSSPHEQRYLLIGESNGLLLTVVYVERGERLRIISARRATRYERSQYLENQAQG